MKVATPVRSTKKHGRMAYSHVLGWGLQPPVVRLLHGSATDPSWSGAIRAMAAMGGLCSGSWVTWPEFQGDAMRYQWLLHMLHLEFLLGTCCGFIWMIWCIDSLLYPKNGWDLLWLKSTGRIHTPQRSARWRTRPPHQRQQSSLCSDHFFGQRGELGPSRLRRWFATCAMAKGGDLGGGCWGCWCLLGLSENRVYSQL